MQIIVLIFLFSLSNLALGADLCSLFYGSIDGQKGLEVNLTRSIIPFLWETVSIDKVFEVSKNLKPGEVQVIKLYSRSILLKGGRVYEVSNLSSGEGRFEVEEIKYENGVLNDAGKHARKRMSDKMGRSFLGMNAEAALIATGGIGLPVAPIVSIFKDFVRRKSEGFQFQLSTRQSRSMDLKLESNKLTLKGPITGEVIDFEGGANRGAALSSALAIGLVGQYFLNSYTKNLENGDSSVKDDKKEEKETKSDVTKEQAKTAK